MDFLTLFGALFGGTAIVAGFLLVGGRFTTLFQLEAFVVVFGGTLGAVMIQNTWARFHDGVRQLRLAFVKARQVDRESLAVLLEWGDRAKLNGMLAFESMEAGGINPFARRGLELLANGVSTPESKPGWRATCAKDRLSCWDSLRQSTYKRRNRPPIRSARPAGHRFTTSAARLGGLSRDCRLVAF